jgi:hypothetical protein
MALTWPDATVYGISALAYWEPAAPVPTHGPVHCALPHVRQPQAGLTCHRVTLSEDTVTRRENVRVQRRVPALVAALVTLSPAQAQSLLAWMIARRKVAAEDFAAAIAAYAPRRGIRRLRSYLPLVAARAASGAELLARSIFIEHGITGWEPNALVRTGRGDAKSADFLIADVALIIMIDGWTYHGNRRAFQVDRQDQNELVAAGHTVLRFTWDDLKDHPAAVAAQVQTMISRLRARRRATTGTDAAIAGEAIGKPTRSTAELTTVRR